MNPRLTAFILSLHAITGAFAQPRGLEQEPLAAEAIGLTMYLPAGSVVTTQAMDQTISYLASDPGATWSLRISTLTPAVAQPTAQALAEQHLQAIQATGRPFQVIANEPRKVGAFLGHLLYIQQVFDDEKQLVNGWLILPNSARSFVVLTILTTAEQFSRLRPVFDASFDSIELRSIDDRLTQRQARLLRGRALIGTLTPEKLRSALSERRWYRIYRPGGSDRIADDTEIGFLSIECTEAMRGQLTPERQPRSFSGMETQRGLMVLVEARAIIDGERSHYLDEAKKLLILGGTGLVGSTLTQYATSKFDIHITSNQNEGKFEQIPDIQINFLEEYERLVKTIKSLKPNFIVHTVAYPSVDFCENHKKEASFLHIGITDKIALASKEINSKLIFFVPMPPC